MKLWILLEIFHLYDATRETILDSLLGNTSLFVRAGTVPGADKKVAVVAGRWLFCLWEAGCAVWFCWLSNRSSGSRSRALCYVTRTAGISSASLASRHDDARAKDWILRLPACSSRRLFGELEFQRRVGRAGVKFYSFRLFLLPGHLSSTDTGAIFKVYSYGETLFRIFFIFHIYGKVDYDYYSIYLFTFQIRGEKLSYSLTWY